MKTQGSLYERKIDYIRTYKFSSISICSEYKWTYSARSSGDFSPYKYMRRFVQASILWNHEWEKKCVCVSASLDFDKARPKISPNLKESFSSFRFYWNTSFPRYRGAVNYLITRVIIFDSLRMVQTVIHDSTRKADIKRKKNDLLSFSWKTIRLRASISKKKLFYLILAYKKTASSF